jgi:DNA-binding NtrC family response regulator
MEESAFQSSRKTVLVVDDDKDVLDLVSQLMVDCEYNVLTAGSGLLGLQKSHDYKGEIHLLLSDFEMPKMSGIDLASAMTRERPNIKVLLMSGFTDGTLVLNEGWHFLAKPFLRSQLRALVAGLLSQDQKFRTSHPGEIP